MELNHFDKSGNAIMVDVSHKSATLRIAAAEAKVKMSPQILKEITEHKISKGDVFAVARIAGIQGGKETSRLIPLSHPLSLHNLTIDFESDIEKGEITISATVKAFEKTGVEMEAMTAASVAALTIYDMCKGCDKSITISEIKLIYKEGGKSGVFRRGELL